jgi:hypothetical protein
MEGMQVETISDSDPRIGNSFAERLERPARGSHNESCGEFAMRPTTVASQIH